MSVPTERSDERASLRAENARLRRVTTWLVGGVVALGLALSLAAPRAVAYDAASAENLLMREKIREIEHTIAQVDRILLRLRLYDAQLRTLGEPKGDHGPTDIDLPGVDGISVAFDQVPLDGPEIPPQYDGEVLDAGDEDVGPGLPPAPFANEGARSPLGWLDAMHGRAQTFLGMFEAGEADMHGLLARLEDVKALEAALPRAWPTNGVFTSGYGWRRAPVGKRVWRFHSGIDVAGPQGTKVRAAARGKVLVADWNGSYGRFVEIDHGYGITTAYAHFRKLLVKEGDLVEAGQLVGLMGSTGRSTGPHLHFEVRIDGNAVDPMQYLPSLHPERR